MAGMGFIMYGLAIAIDGSLYWDFGDGDRGTVPQLVTKTGTGKMVVLLLSVSRKTVIATRQNYAF
jgi:hypothetical protein